MAAQASTTSVVHLVCANRKPTFSQRCPSGQLPPNVVRLHEPRAYVDAVERQAREIECAREIGRIKGQQDAAALAGPSPEMELIAALIEALDEPRPAGRRKAAGVWYRTMSRMVDRKRHAAKLGAQALFEVRRLDREAELAAAR